MNDPHRLLLEYLLAFQDPEKASSMFAEDGVFEMPYLVSVGIEPRHEGRESIRGFISGVLDLYPDFRFAADDVTVLIDTPGRRSRSTSLIRPLPPPAGGFITCSWGGSWPTTGRSSSCARR